MTTMFQVLHITLLISGIIYLLSFAIGKIYNNRLGKIINTASGVVFYPIAVYVAMVVCFC